MPGQGQTDVELFGDWQAKVSQMLIGIGAFLLVIVALMLIAGVRWRKPKERLTVLLFAGPAVALLLAGLVYPAVRTFIQSFFNSDSSAFVGFNNYQWIFTDSDSLTSIRNTILWVVIAPIFSASIGLIYAVLIDRARFEKVAKSLLFMPMAISFVGAGIIWKFMYAYKGPRYPQIGLLNQVLVWLGGEPQAFLNLPPWNNFFLIIVMIWVQAGFAMVLLSAAIRNIPTDITEAARLDGASAWKMFWSITIPSIRPTLVVVWTTISIAVLKVFDIVRTMTGGQFGTEVVANSMYNQSFRFAETGKGAALAVLLFITVVPLVIYNIRQMARNREVRG